MGDFAPSHPGETLLEDFLMPLCMSHYALAKALDVPQECVSEIINAQCGITAETALRLARYFGTSPEFWLGMQTTYDLERARDRLGNEIETRVQPRAA